MPILGRWHEAKSLIWRDNKSPRRPKSAVVKTYPISTAGLVCIDCRRHVSATNPTKEGRQDARLLEHRREQASRRWPGGAAPRPVSGRDQLLAGCGVAQGHRGLRRGRRASADAGAVPRGSLSTAVAADASGGAASPVGHAAVPAAAMGRLLAGRSAVAGVGAGSLLGRRACRRAARARAGIRSCRFWCPTG